GIIFKALNKQKIYNRILIIEAVTIGTGLFFLNQTIYQIATVLTIAIFIHLILGLLLLNRYVKLMPKKIILNILAGKAFILIEVYLSKSFELELFLTFFNAIIF